MLGAAAGVAVGLAPGTGGVTAAGVHATTVERAMSARTALKRIDIDLLLKGVLFANSSHNYPWEGY
jgi:hypothetical protein